MIKPSVKIFWYSFSLLLVAFTQVANADFSWFASHPEATSLYPVEYSGRAIQELKTDGSRIYMGFGADDGPPPGGYVPLAIRYISNPSNGISSVQGYLSSQEMSVIQGMQNKLFILSVDWEGEDYEKCTTAGCTSGHLSPRSHHALAAVEYNGDLYIAGSHTGGSGYEGGVWRSTNGGSSWSLVKSIGKENSSIPCCTRTSFLAVQGGSLYAQAYQYDSPCANGASTCNWEPQNTLYKLTGSSWTSSQQQVLFSATIVYSINFNGEVLYKEWDSLRSFDGTSTPQVYGGYIRDFTVNDGYVYLLTTSGDVMQSNNSTAWRKIDQHSADGREIEVVNGSLYVGDKNGKLYISDQTVPIPPVITPQTSLLLLD